MYKILNKTNKKIKFIGLSLLAVLLIAWGIKFYTVNANSFQQKNMYYKTGEWVKLDGSFFFDGIENTKGYSIRVNNAHLEKYDELMKRYNQEINSNSEFPNPKYVGMLNITVKNVGNKKGYFNAMAFALYKDALQIPIDFEIWNIIDEKIDGNTILKLREDSEATLTIPFTAQPLDEAVNSKRLNNILENDTLEFCICDFPVRKLINIKFH